LTDKGRELLSKNQLNFVYYAFSDEGINYKQNLASAIQLSQSVDAVSRKTLFFEADQRRDRDLSSFLYTIPEERRVLPSVTLNVNVSSSISLERRYSIKSLSGLQSFSDGTEMPPIDIVAQVALRSIDEINAELQRATGYGNKQLIEFVLSGLSKLG
jgi:hypothetical protein